jgi:pimeloyl-ACP methyl ester carboxylesterase
MNEKRLPSLEQWQAAGRRFMHRGESVFYRLDGTAPQAGQGRALLLIHGFPTASWDWAPLWPRLREHYNCVVAPDLIGFGFSAKPRDYPYSILDQAELCADLLTEIGVRRVHVLAHDYGDTVAQELLARDIDRRGIGHDGPELQSVCFLNGGLFPETHRARPIQKLLASPLGGLLTRFMNERRFERSFGAVFGPHTRPSPSEMQAFWTLASRDGGIEVAPKLIGYMRERQTYRERWVGALQRSKVPLCVIDGAEDPVSGAHMVQRYRELVPNPDTVLLQGIGHYPQVEDPDGTWRAYAAFLERITHTGRSP